MNIRFVISHINKDGMRTMTYAVQGRNTRGSKKEARGLLRNFLANNAKETLIGIYGSQSIGTFEVSAVECYEGHNDPKGCFIQEELNPGQVCLVGELKDILDKIDKREVA